MVIAHFFLELRGGGGYDYKVILPMCLEMSIMMVFLDINFFFIDEMRTRPFEMMVIQFHIHLCTVYCIMSLLKGTIFENSVFYRIMA